MFIVGYSARKHSLSPLSGNAGSGELDVAHCTAARQTQSARANNDQTEFLSRSLVLCHIITVGMARSFVHSTFESVAGDLWQR